MRAREPEKRDKGGGGHCVRGPLSLGKVDAKGKRRRLCLIASSGMARKRKERRRFLSRREAIKNPTLRLERRRHVLGGKKKNLTQSALGACIKLEKGEPPLGRTTERGS